MLVVLIILFKKLLQLILCNQRFIFCNLGSIFLINLKELFVFNNFFVLEDLFVLKNFFVLDDLFFL